MIPLYGLKYQQKMAQQRKEWGFFFGGCKKLQKLLVIGWQEVKAVQCIVQFEMLPFFGIRLIATSDLAQVGVSSESPAPSTHTMHSCFCLTQAPFHCYIYHQVREKSKHCYFTFHCSYYGSVFPCIWLTEVTWTTVRRKDKIAPIWGATSLFPSSPSLSKNVLTTGLFACNIVAVNVNVSKGACHHRKHSLQLPAPHCNAGLAKLIEVRKEGSEVWGGSEFQGCSLSLSLSLSEIHNTSSFACIHSPRSNVQ